MKNHRIVVSRHGGPDVLKVLEEDIPEPQAGEVRVKVLAAGVSAYDLMFRRSSRLPRTPRVPFTLGEDVVGVVDKLGEGVSTVEPGQMVAAATFSLGVGGGYAEFVCIPAADWVPVPPGVDPAEAVCLVINYLTAHVMLHRAANVQRGERALVHGAAGGVGTALLELGKRCTARRRSTTMSSWPRSGQRRSITATRTSSNAFVASPAMEWMLCSTPSAAPDRSAAPTKPCAGEGGWSGSAWRQPSGRGCESFHSPCWPSGC